MHGSLVHDPYPPACQWWIIRAKGNQVGPGARTRAAPGLSPLGKQRRPHIFVVQEQESTFNFGTWQTWVATTSPLTTAGFAHAGCREAACSTTLSHVVQSCTPHPFRTFAQTRQRRHEMVAHPSSLVPRPPARRDRSQSVVPPCAGDPNTKGPDLDFTIQVHGKTSRLYL